MSTSGGKTRSKHVEVPRNEYEQQRLQRIEANKTKMINLGLKRIAASSTSLVDSTNKKKGLHKSKNKAMLHQDSDYTPEDDSVEDDTDEVVATAYKKRKVTSKEVTKKGVKNKFIPPMLISNLLKHNKNKQGGREKQAGNMQFSTAIKVLQEAINSQQEEDGQKNINFDEDLDDYEEVEDHHKINEDSEMDKEVHDNCDSHVANHEQYMLFEKEGEVNIPGKRKVKKSYKTNTPRGPTRNLQMAKLRPGEKIKVDFNVNGEPIGVNRATLSSYCGSLVRDPLNAPLYGVRAFSQVPEENKEKMWKLVLDKFDIGLDDDQEEEAREKKLKERKKYIMRSFNKKYRNFRARLKSEYYDTEETDADRLKEENRPPSVDEKDWEWLVEYFGSPKFQKKSLRNIENRSYLDAGHTSGTKSFAQKAQDMFERDKVMPGLLDLYEETHTKSDKTPVTEMAHETLNEIKNLLEQRKAGEINMTDEEIYAKVKPKRKTCARDRGMGISPSITSLFGSFSEGEKFRKEAEEAKNEANEAKKEATEAKEENIVLTNQIKGLQKESRVTRHLLGKFMHIFGYDLSDLNIDELSDEESDKAQENDDEDDEEFEEDE